ncbi:MAG: TIGR01459 family HAD-type hydrolase [Pseudomonadota bacterium]
MTRFIDKLAEVAADYDAVVLDQWGVLHDGQTPYPGAVEALKALHRSGTRLAVLSNSGKRSDLNAARIASKGFPETLFEVVMTSGEALYLDIAAGVVPQRRLYPIEGAPGDAAQWAGDQAGVLVASLELADAVLLMGLPDGDDHSGPKAVLETARARDLPLYCSNPDRKSPRGGGYVTSPGALAHDYADAGGTVRFYGKPHRPVYDALVTALGSDNLLMVGDSLEHDIAGAQAAGWDSLFVRGGIHAPDFAGTDLTATLTRLVAAEGAAVPTHSIEVLQ